MDSVFKALTVYIVLWAIIRVSGRRTMAELSTFDFVMFLIIGGATQRALIGQDYSLINAFVVIATLFVIDIIVGLLERDSTRFGKIIKGVPTVLVERGHMLKGRMRRARVTENEILEAARCLHGLETMDQIKFAILEAGGDISIIPTGEPAGKRAAAKE
jgi:uncharacterized membrane protein YcaP (DUF421 family)